LECLDRLAATTNKSRLREETTPEGHRCAGGNRRWGRIVQTRQASKQERKIDDGAAAAERKERLFVYGILFKFERHAEKTGN
jgi:hypothetical protein